jgi:hypothetical protein
MAEVPGFRKGAQRAKEASKGAQFAKTNFLSIEDGKSVIVRFLIDAEETPGADTGAWISVDQHQSVPTKKAPADFEGTWPEKMSAVCRKTKLDDDGTTWHDECYICDFLVDGKKVKKAKSRTWALACLREEVIENGKVLGLKDVTRQVAVLDKDGKPTGDEKTEKAIVVLNYGYDNFFGAVQAYYGMNGTVLDRDFWIKREGAQLDTVYRPIGKDPIKLKDGSILDVRNPEHMQRYGFDDQKAAYAALQEIVAERGSEEFYARFFDPRYTASEGKVQSTGADVAKPSNDAEEDRLEALRSRVTKYQAPEKDGEEQASEKSAEQPEKPAKVAETAAAGPAGMRDFDE